MTSIPGAPPWWLEAGPEICEFCQRAFHIEAGYRCRGCDRPVCPLCATVSRRGPDREATVSCPQCASEDNQ